MTAILGNPLTAANSLYGILSVAEPTLLTGLADHWNQHRDRTPTVDGTAYRPALGAFSAISSFWGNTYSDQRLAGVLYGPPFAANTAAVTGANTAAGFLRDFEAARDEAFYVFLQGQSVNELAQVSFLSTYYHHDVSELFVQRPHSRMRAIVSRRVIETAQVMLRILYGNMSMGWGTLYSTRTLATTLLLAQMHNRLLAPYRSRVTERPVYNQSSVAFTLLTFSYVVAQSWVDARYEFDQGRWYYFWKLLGSLLGIDSRLIADNHAEAGDLWRRFFQAGECRGGNGVPYATNLEEDRIDAGLVAGYHFAPEANLLQWVPAFIVTQLRNAPRWYRYFRR
ncbi:oxygenase MpaB family protein [Corallococcus llansteffanensis]|uniref:oxygenase MpaB family protein n=1 Tax=Corallococcus llansteffanensis TaxID=2316731 RepID=UPI0011C42EDA|nr:oxygenase MpaB family protein [Corallococcus llansteffanensis]